MIRKIKPHFTASDVARMAGVDKRALLDLEQRGGVPPARRNEANHRVYDFEEAFERDYPWSAQP